MNNTEIIAVIQAFERDGRVLCRAVEDRGSWVETLQPVWNFDAFDYAPIGYDSIDFDPLDLAQLAGAYELASGQQSLSDSEFLTSVAMMLNRLWLEVKDEWDGVWAYDVAAPLGTWIGENGVTHIQPAKTRARELIKEAMRGGSS